MGLSFDSHPILPIGFIIAFFLYQMMNYRKFTIRSFIAPVLIFLVVTLPVTFSVIKSVVFTIQGSVTHELDAELIWKYVRFAQPQSAFIDIIPQFHYGLSLYFSSFLLLLLFYNYGDEIQKAKYSKLFFLLFTIFIFTIFEILNSYYFKIIPLYNLWLHRFMTYGSVITYIILAGSSFYVIRENKNNSFFIIGLFFLLCFSVFAQELGADLYTIFWMNHFYILAAAIGYYFLNFYYAYFRSKLPFKVLAVNLIFLLGTLIYFYHIATYDRLSVVQSLSKSYAVWNMDLDSKEEVVDLKGRHSAISFNTSMSKGYMGSARYFNGRDSYIKTSVNFKGWKSVTISLWVKSEKKGRNGSSVILDNGHAAEKDFVIQTADFDNPDSGRWVFRCNGVDIPLIIPFYRWSNIVIIMDAAGGVLQAYVDGVRSGRVVLDKGFEFGDEPLSIGKLAKMDDRYFKGSIDEVVIWK